MAFTGAWSRQQGPFYTQGDYAVHTADPAHADTEAPDLNASDYTAPDGMTSSGYGIPVEDWMGGQGVPMDNSPQDHSAGSGAHPFVSDVYIGASGIGGGTLTAQEKAACETATRYDAPPYYNTGNMQWYDERHFDIRSDGLQSGGIDPVVNQRGPNSLPENNPPIEGQPLGYRLGSDLVVGLDRKMNWGRRYHDRHVVTPNDADVPTNQIRPDGNSPYLSPFDSAKRAITRAWNTPMRVESPPPMDDSITVDTAVGYGMQPDWGFL